MKKGIIFLCTIFDTFSLSAQTYYIKDFGAMAQGKALNTVSIQRTIDECFQKRAAQRYKLQLQSL